MEYITREEKYLGYLSGDGDAVIPKEPYTRKEMYLAYLCGQDVTIPSVPITREEMYLAHLCGGNNTIPEEPLTRLEQYMAFACAEYDHKPTPITRLEMLWNDYQGGQVPSEKTIDFCPVISVSDAVAGNVIDFTAKITAKQTGTGDPSPQNICPIDGWTGAEITRTLKNMLTSYTAGNPYGLTGSVLTDGGIRFSGVPTWGTGTYDFRFCGIDDDFWSQFKNNSSVKIKVFGSNEYFTPLSARFDTAISALVVRGKCVATSESITLDLYPMVYVGDEPQSFEIGAGTVYPDSWESEAGIVFGGVRDLTNGTLTVTHIKKKIGDESITWNYQSSGGRLYTQSLNNIIVKAPSNQTAYPDIIKCTCYKTVSATATGSSTGNLGIAVSNSGAIYLRDENYTSASDFVRDMGDEYILYQLAEPITYTLTSTDIVLSEGANTLWSDTGDSSMTYLANAAENVRVMNATLSANNALLKSGKKISISKPNLVKA